MKVNDRVFIVTGGASGLGEAIAKRISQMGGKVAIFDCEKSKADIVVSAMPPTAGKAYEVNIMDEASIQAGVERTMGEFGRIDGVINCAGAGMAMPTLNKKSLKPHSITSFEKLIKLNLIGTFSVSSKCAAKMAANEADEGGVRGVIINVASIAAFEGQNGQAAYASSKGGVVALTLPLARDLSSWGIRVNTIAPGIIATPLSNSLKGKLLETLQNAQAFPHNRFGSVDEVAHLCIHMIENDFLNGETVRLDGAIRMPKL